MMDLNSVVGRLSSNGKVGELLSISLRRFGVRRLESDEIEKLLEEAKIARICCHNEDGSIHATPVWFRYKDGCIRIPIHRESRKARNLKRNKNVTILVDEVSPARMVMIYGLAELDAVDVINKAVFVNEKYQTKEDARATVEGYFKETDLILTVKPKRMITFTM